MEELTRLEWLLGNDYKKLQDKTVLVLGLGGVGGYALETLVRSGIGNLILVDFDTVDITNTNRQLIATKETIGKLKTDAWECMRYDSCKMLMY